ncbi:MAG: S26 family signal peptidase [Candidatus Micrarchaeota archaeon]|nr:S26 family signal peptidase [Candidatus Micrarchaeota archaeon]
MKTKFSLSSPNIFLPIATVLFLLLYTLTLQPLFGVLCLASFLAYVSLDFLTGAEKKGRSSLVDVIYAILAAAVVWLALSAALQTPSPLDVVTSCSMNHVLDRGDLVIVQGQSVYNAPIVDFEGNFPEISVQRSNCTVSKRGQNSTIAICTSHIILKNSTSIVNVSVSRSQVPTNDVIVFESKIAGLIIHRSILGLRNLTTSQVTYMTKGDNNQVVDQEAGIDFIESSKVHGRMIARIPLIGYMRLFLAGQFTEPRGCDTLVETT